MKDYHGRMPFLFVIKNLKKIFNFFLKKHSNTKKKSYSQCGEDLIIQYIFQLRGISNPTYIDIGAHHPYFLNNTAIFYEKGSSGINIDANPNLINLFKSERPKDINLNIGIGEKKEVLDFYLMEDNTLSTFSKEEFESMTSKGKKLQEIKQIEVTTLDGILNIYFNNKYPDLLSIDIEGLDFEVLKSIDYNKDSPKVICVEAAEYSPIGAGARRDELINYLIENGYYEYANTNLNAIMVRKDYWFI